MQRLSRMPEAGDEIMEDEFRLTVETLSDNRVGLLLIERIKEETAEDTPPAAD